MSITNYWFQLIWLLTVGMVLAISLPKKQEIVMGRIEERWQIFCFYGFDPQEEIQNMAHPYHSNTDSSNRHILHSKKADRHHNRYHPDDFTFRSYRHRPMLYEAVEMLLI